MAFGVLLIASAASSVFGTQVHQYSSPAALAGVAAFAAFVGVALALGLPRGRAGASREWLPALIAGGGGFAVAPWLVAANRYTDAPPGSEVVFLTTVAWGGLLAIALAWRSRGALVRAAGAALAMAAGAALVANWERPSSFSLFFRYAREEATMLAAGLLWVALVLVLGRSARRGRLSMDATIAALGGIAAAVALAAAGLARGSFALSDLSQPGLVGFSIACAFATAATVSLVGTHRLQGIAAAYLLVPVTISSLSVVEQLTRPFGPQPIVIVPAIASAVCVLAGVRVVWQRDGREQPSDAARDDEGRMVAGRLKGARRVAVALAVAGLACAVLSLATPAMTTYVHGLRADGSSFDATFALFGYEVAGSWIATALALLGLGIALERQTDRAGSTVRLAALVAASAGFFGAAATPLRTLNSFVPSDVQVDYGSEFARIGFEGGPSAWAIAAVACALAAAALAVASARRWVTDV